MPHDGLRPPTEEEERRAERERILQGDPTAILEEHDEHEHEEEDDEEEIPEGDPDDPDSMWQALKKKRERAARVAKKVSGDGLMIDGALITDPMNGLWMTYDSSLMSNE